MANIEPANPASLTLDRVTRRFAGQVAVHELSLEINAGELLALVGASGSGKTTTLRMVAGYEAPDSGSIRLDGRDITALPPERRGFGMVFQHYALFPHLSVQDNVGFGLEARGINATDRRARALQALENVGLGAKAGRQVQALSGGEQQRVAMARAMVIQPRVLLLDEPLSNLDPTLREEMRTELRATLQRAAVTALFVTHDQEDAFAIADRVALLEHGKLPAAWHARAALRSAGVASSCGVHWSIRAGAGRGSRNTCTNYARWCCAGCGGDTRQRRGDAGRARWQSFVRRASRSAPVSQAGPDGSRHDGSQVRSWRTRWMCPERRSKSSPQRAVVPLVTPCASRYSVNPSRW